MSEKTLRSETVFTGRLLEVDVLEVELDSGARSIREIVRHPGAAAVLAELPDGRFVLVRQFRKPCEAGVVEIVAGVLEPGEEPGECAARELEEETGHKAEELTKLGMVRPSPGYTDEVVHLYHARVDAVPGSSRPESDERIEVLHVDRSAAERMMAAGQISDAKTLAAWLLYSVKAQGSGSPP